MPGNEGEVPTCSTPTSAVRTRPRGSHGHGRGTQGDAVTAHGRTNLGQRLHSDRGGDRDAEPRDAGGEADRGVRRRQAKAGYAARTINRHFHLLNLILSAALRRGLVRINPVRSLDRPREPRRRWRILTPAEVGAVERAFAELIAEAKGEERTWREQPRVIFRVAMGTGLRRDELQGLRWRNVNLADPDGAFLRVGITDYVRLFHDLRHSSITNAAAAGTPPAALMARAGHSSFTTTQGYIDLAGETFREEADRLEEGLWGSSGTKNRYQKADSSSESATGPVAEPVGETA